MFDCHSSSRGSSPGVARKVLPFSLFCCAVAFVQAGCGSSNTAAATASPSSNLKVSQSDFGAQFDRSRCDDKGKQVVSADTNGDGKPDVVKLFTVVDQGGQKVQQLACRQVDLNHDGKMDIIYTYAANGSLMAEDFDLDFDGKFDERVYYQEGKKVRMERDMDGDGKPDYLEFFEGGKLVRAERDSNGDGKADEWMYYENGKLDRIGRDTTGSGRADKWERNPESAEAAPEAAPAPKDNAAPAAPAAPASKGTTPAPSAAAGTDSTTPKAPKK
jgi:hypothetical protein